ncbi:MAG: hypothetical protein WBF33_17400, partial [Candidatus Nitrosopolaris sp.]
RLFVEWLVEAYYLRMFLQLSHIPHYTTLQKFSSRINGTLLKILSSFILLLDELGYGYSKITDQSCIYCLFRAGCHVI